MAISIWIDLFFAIHWFYIDCKTLSTLPGYLLKHFVVLKYGSVNLSEIKYHHNCKYWNRLAAANSIDIGLGGSVGCAVRLETRRSRVQPPPRSATFFHGD